MTGPELWHNTFASCNGQRQSPININSSCLEKVKYPCDLHLLNVDVRITNVKLQVLDFSITAKLAFDSHRVPLLAGGPLNPQELYSFVSLHCHWGIMDNDGSEHTINQQKMPIECHYIFLNNKYPDFATATSKPDGLAVVAKFYKIDPLAKPIPLFNGFLIPNEKNLDVFEYKPPYIVTFSAIFGNGFFNYAHYPGSLTTPPCSESVSWFVILDVGSIRPEQVSIFLSFIVGFTRD